MSYSLVVLSAGKGVRFGKNTPKQYVFLADKPILVHSLQEAEKVNDIAEIIIVCDELYHKTIEEYIIKYNLNKKYILVNGGSTRQDSVYRGISVATCDNVIVHDGVRPFVPANDFQALIDAPYECAAYTYSIPFTVLKKDENNCVVNDILNRDELVNIQAPQKFSKNLLLQAHESARTEGKVFVEDVGLVKHYTDAVVYCLQGSAQNIKITEQIDLLFAEAIYKQRIDDKNQVLKNDG